MVVNVDKCDRDSLSHHFSLWASPILHGCAHDQHLQTEAFQPAIWQNKRWILEGFQIFRTDQVDPKSNAANDQDQFWILDLLRLQESLDWLDSDGKAERDQEDWVDKSPHNLVKE